MNFFKKYRIFLLLGFLVITGFVFFLIQNKYFGSLAPIENPKKDVSTCEMCGKEIKFVKIGGKMIKVELTRTAEEQERGLSGRKSLKDDEGMLFIFPKLGKYYFWMKEMNFPIDIIWLDQNFQIIYIKKDAQPASYPNAFGPAVDNQYVLEVSDGFSEKNNLKTGDRVEFLP